MKYKIYKKKESTKPDNIKLSKNIYQIKINKINILINNQNLIDKILLKEIFKKLDPTLNKILNYLLTEEDNEEESSKLYDELAKIRSIILKKYEKEVSIKAKEQYMKKIRFLAIELNKRILSYSLKETKTITK